MAACAINFIFDSKVLLAALQLPHLRQRIALHDAAALAILDRVIPVTYVLDPLDANGYGKVSPSALLAEKDKWVVKFAGYDRGQQAWGRAVRCKLANNR